MRAKKREWWPAMDTEAAGAWRPARQPEMARRPRGLRILEVGTIEACFGASSVMWEKLKMQILLVTATSQLPLVC